MIKFDKQYWFLPLVFVPFAFNGLLPYGNIPNLNYYAYAHFFSTSFIFFTAWTVPEKCIINKTFDYSVSFADLVFKSPKDLSV